MAFLDFQSFIRQTLSRFSPSDARKGTAVDELSVKPVAALLMDVNDQMSAVVQLQDIGQSDAWSDSQVAAYGRFYKTPWVTGKKASGFVRVFVDQPANIMVRTDAVTAFSRQGYTYTPAFDINISSLEFALDKIRGLYWVDIPMVSSSTGSNYNIVSGSISRVDGLGVAYKSVTNPEDFVDGSAGESRDEYLDRLSYALSDKAVLGYHSIKSSLKQLFPVVKSVYIAGADDPYMTRDILPIPGSSSQKTSYLGKTPGVMTVPHTAYKDVFPPEPDSATLLTYGPAQPVSEYAIPTAVVSVDYLNADPAQRGFRLSRELDSDGYSGIYFDDGLTGIDASTSNTLDFANIDSFNSSFPNQAWVIGDNGKTVYDFETHTASDVAIDRSEYVVMSGGELSLKTGESSVYTYASYDVYRNGGISVSGQITVSDSVGSEHMVLAAAPNNANALTGLGFGLSKIMSGEDEKWVFYITQNGSGSSGQIFMRPDDLISGYSLGGISTLAEHVLAGDAIASDMDLWFNMTIGSDYNVTVSLVDNASGISIDTITIGGPIAKQVENTIASTPGAFGTRLKFVANAKSPDAVIFKNVICRDTNPRRPTALFLVDVTGFTAPMVLTLKARGSGAVNGVSSYGYTVYSWDNEAPTATGNLAGAWQEVSGLADSGEAQSGFYSGKTWEITNIDRWRCNQLSPNLIALVVTPTAASFTATQYGQQDIDATVGIDYLKIESESNISAKLGNCVDVYVNTYNNSENRSFTSITAQAISGLISLLPAQPIMKVISVVGAAGDITSDVKIIYDTDSYAVKIYLPSQDSSTYSITYAPYYAVDAIQKFFDSKTYGAVVGGIKVKHKYPVDIDMTWSYSGSGDLISVDSAIRAYADSRPDEVFDMQLCFQSLSAAGLCSSLGVESKLSYIDPESGEHVESQRAVIRPIDFFRISSIQVVRQ